MIGRSKSLLLSEPKTLGFQLKLKELAKEAPYNVLFYPHTDISYSVNLQVLYNKKLGLVASVCVIFNLYIAQNWNDWPQFVQSQTNSLQSCPCTEILHLLTLQGKYNTKLERLAPVCGIYN